MRARLFSFLYGALGALLVVLLCLAAGWIHARYQEFVVMRADIIFIHPQIETARQQQRAAAAAAAPVESPQDK